MASRDVLILNESTPQLEVAQSGDEYNFPRNVNMEGTLDVTGATICKSTLGVTGVTTLSDTLGVTKNITASSGLTVGKTLDVTGASTLSGAQKINRTVVSGATYSITASDYLLGVTRTATGTCAITFPTAQITTNRVWLIKDEGGGASTYNITIGTQGAETIDGAATLTINVNYRMVTIYSNGTNLFSDKYSFKWEDLK